MMSPSEHAKRLREIYDAAEGQRKVNETLRQFAEIVSVSLGAELPRETPPADVSDETSWISASKIMAGRFDNLTALRRWLDKIGENVIRRRKPSEKRLEIHAGDWLQHWAEQDRRRAELLDDESLQDQIADTAARMEAEKMRKRAAENR